MSYDAMQLRRVLGHARLSIDCTPTTFTYSNSLPSDLMSHDIMQLCIFLGSARLSVDCTPTTFTSFTSLPSDLLLKCCFRSVHPELLFYCLCSEGYWAMNNAAMYILDLYAHARLHQLNNHKILHTPAPLHHQILALMLKCCPLCVCPFDPKSGLFSWLANVDEVLHLAWANNAGKGC